MVAGGKILILSREINREVQQNAILASAGLHNSRVYVGGQTTARSSLKSNASPNEEVTETSRTLLAMVSDDERMLRGCEGDGWMKEGSSQRVAYSKPDFRR